MGGDSYFGAKDWDDLLAYMSSERKKIINLDDQVKQLSSMVRQYETALRIKNEEHDCCAEDLLEAIKDSERLNWLMRNVSGKEFCRMGRDGEDFSYKESSYFTKPLYAAPPAIPEGYVLVPKEPSNAILNAMYANKCDLHDGDLTIAYKAMLKAAQGEQE